MDFSQVRYFLALAETLNFTRAAEKCHVTQPTLTQAIKRLEEELGGPLIYREGRYSRLTKLGQSLRTHFEKIEQTRQAAESLRPGRNQRRNGRAQYRLDVYHWPQDANSVLGRVSDRAPARTVAVP